MARRFAASILLLTIGAITVFLLVSHGHSSNLTPEEIDLATLDLIDFAKLEPAVANFIDLARKNETVGKPTSAFPDLWLEATSNPPAENSGRFQWWEFILPETTDLKKQNNSNIANKEGVLYWPMLMVRVDSQQSIIVRVAVFTQGF